MSLRPKPLRLSSLLAAALAFLAVLAGSASPGPKKPRAVAPVSPTPAPAASWKEVERLVADQKLEEASRRVDQILRAARARKDEAEWTKALVREVQLRIGLHGYETAVRFLKEEPWPSGTLSRVTLELFYAQALVQYERAYSWEIARRERIESAAPLDLKTWTEEQILAEAERAYLEVWKRRTELGRLPVGVLSELMNDDGSVTRGKQVAAFAERHGLKTISVADLIAYRQARDKLIERVAEFEVASEIGPLKGYAYVTPFDEVHHMAFVYGRIGAGRNVLARLHRADVIGDVIGGAKPIHAALQRFKREGSGVIVYLRDGAAGVPTTAIPQETAVGSEAARNRQWREVGLGAQILKDLGISSIRLLSSSHRTYVGLAGFGIEIVSTEALEG